MTRMLTNTVILIGCGVVGKATGKGLIKNGNTVKFVDRDLGTVSTLKSQGYEAYSLEEYPYLQGDITMVCVSTPTNMEGKIDFSSIQNASINIGKWLAKNNNNYHTIVIRSTVPPYTTRNMILPLIELYSQQRAGVNFGICMQPEFLRAASSESDFLNQWFTVIGEYDKKSSDKIYQLYKRFCNNITITDLETAEFMKYVHNCFNAVKISFANEMWSFGKKIGIDANHALELATSSAEGYWNPKYGTVGGAPYGGACLPKDTKGFISYAKDNNITLDLLEAVDRVNEALKMRGSSKPEIFVNS